MQTQREVIDTAIRYHKAVEFIYRKPNGAMSVRTIVPAEILTSAQGVPSVGGYDLGRRAYRKYRLDRMHGEPIMKPKPPAGYDSTEFEPEEFS